MARWILSNVQKKNVLELEYFKHPKHYKPIVIENWWRWGTFECESDEKPDIDLENDDPDGFYVYATDYDFSTVSLDDGVSTDIVWPDDMSEEERERLQEIYDEEGYDGWLEEGIDATDTEVIIFGPMELEMAESE